MKAPAIARQLKRSPGAVYARINALKKVSAPAASLPTERLAFFRARCVEPKREDAPLREQPSTSALG